MIRRLAVPALAALLFALVACDAGDVSGGSGSPAAASGEPAVHAFAVEGMHCEGCVAGITGELGQMKGVQAVNVSLEDKLARVTVAPDGPAAHRIVEAIRSLGFTTSETESSVPATP